MLKLFKNLKKTWTSVLIIIILLFLQAWTDLTLPDYTSKIVNTGIQAGGIEYISPEIIRKSQMENILMFSENDEEILNNYTLISKNTLSEDEFKSLQKKYPELENQDLYEINKLSKKQKSELEEDRGVNFEERQQNRVKITKVQVNAIGEQQINKKRLKC